ncbi:MAG: ATP synthase F1 subunit delta [Ferruginibacter sp.]
MNNPRLAGRYAKSLVGLATEQNQLEAMYNDMKYLQSIFKSNADVVALLRSPIINADKKEKIIAAITTTNIGKLSYAFIKLLIDKGRERNLPEIADEVITQYNTIHNIHKVKITTAVPMSEDLKNTVINKLKVDAALENIELETAVNEELIGGFVLETQGNLVDASILRDLKDVRKQFLNNDYIHQIR